MSFESLGLSTKLLQAVSEQGYTEPRPVQQQAIPVIFEGATSWPALKPAPEKPQVLPCPCYKN